MRISDWSSDVCSSDLLHDRSDGGIEGVTPADVVADLGDGLVDLSAQVFLFGVERARVECHYRARSDMPMHQRPKPTQEARHALHTGLVPLKALLGRRGKHREQANGIGAVQSGRAHV